MVPDETSNVTLDPANQYLLEYSFLTSRVSAGKEATDVMCDFWEKLAFIEYQYAKSIAQLCHSRFGKLQKMFPTNDRIPEYYRPLKSLWGAVIEDLVCHSESHLNLAYALQRDIKPSLNRFSQNQLTKQIEVSQHGKKVIQNLKDDYSKLNIRRKKLYKTLINENRNEAPFKVDDKGAEPAQPDNKGTVEAKQLQKLWIRTRDSHAHTYNITMPSIIEEINDISVQRVQEICNGVGTYTNLMKNMSSGFKTTPSTLLSAQTSAENIRYTMETCPPPIPDIERALTRDEMIAFCETPAKKLLQNIQGMFATNHGIFGISRQSSETGEADNNSFKDISQKVSNLLTTLRTRTLSGNVVETGEGVCQDVGNDEKILNLDMRSNLNVTEDNAENVEGGNKMVNVNAIVIDDYTVISRDDAANNENLTVQKSRDVTITREREEPDNVSKQPSDDVLLLNDDVIVTPDLNLSS